MRIQLSLFALLFVLLSSSDANLSPYGEYTQLHISKASEEAYKKYLEETCQSVDQENRSISKYLEWELHEFITSLRVELLPETKGGNLTSFVLSPLKKYLPISSLLGVEETSRLQCSRNKKGRNNTDEKIIKQTSFEDFLIDLLLSQRT